MVEYKQGDAPDFSRDAWYDVKYTLGLDLPNLPYFIDGDLKLTETYAIHRYLANKYCPALSGRTVEEKARTDMLSGIVQELKMEVTRPCYTTGDKTEILKAVDSKLPKIIKMMSGSKFLVGDNLVWLDFYFFRVGTVALLSFA